MIKPYVTGALREPCREARSCALLAPAPTGDQLRLGRGSFKPVEIIRSRSDWRSRVSRPTFTTGSRLWYIHFRTAATLHESS